MFVDRNGYSPLHLLMGNQSVTFDIKLLLFGPFVKSKAMVKANK